MAAFERMKKKYCGTASGYGIVMWSGDFDKLEKICGM